MRFDVGEFEFGTLIIDGILIIEGDTHIKAKNIWIRSGELRAGSADIEFENNLTIELIGDVNGEYIYIDESSDSRTKSISVTGKLQLYGKTDFNSWTQLAQNAKADDTSIVVSDATGW